MTGAVILAGGKSSRMGRDKLELMYEGETFLEAAVRRFSEKFPSVFVSVRDESRYPKIGCRHIADIYPGCGPMGGIHAAIKTTGLDIFAVAGDMPFSSPDAAIRLIELGEGYDAAVPVSGDGKLEPLFAWYSAKILPELEALLGSGQYQMLKLFDRINVRYVKIPELGDAWHDSILDNINRPEDYRRVLGFGGQI